MERFMQGLGVVLIGMMGWMPGAQATRTAVAIEPATAWVIESAEYEGEVKDQIVRLDARYTIQVLRDGWVEVPLALPGATVTDVKIERKSGEAHVVPRGATYVLATMKKGTYRIHVTCSSPLAQDSQFEGIQFGIP